jgi:hypothetical protein
LKENKSYVVKKVNGELSLSGTGDHPLWRNANVLTDFSVPWEETMPPATEFRAIHNNDWLFCLFSVTDDSINVLVDKNDKMETAASCRTEIFFKIDDNLSPYYCLEIDPLARVLDYRAEFHRQFDMNWSWPAGHLKIKTDKKDEGYTIEIAISKKSLTDLGLLKNNTLQAGLYRADCLALNGSCTRFQWMSWVKPDSETPDFHIPSSFGVLKLE